MSLVITAHAYTYTYKQTTELSSRGNWDQRRDLRAYVRVLNVYSTGFIFDVSQLDQKNTSAIMNDGAQAGTTSRFAKRTGANAHNDRYWKYLGVERFRSRWVVVKADWPNPHTSTTCTLTTVRRQLERAVVV